MRSSTSWTICRSSTAGSRCSTKPRRRAPALARRRSKRASPRAWCSPSRCASRSAPISSSGSSARSAARATGVHTWTFQLLVHGYGTALGAGDLETAAAIAKELAPLAPQAGRLSQVFYHHFQGWEAMLRKDLMRALQMEKTAVRLAVEVGCPYFEALCRLALAQVLLECGDQRKCIAQLQRMRAIVRDIPNRHLEFTCLLGFADMALAHGRPRPGLKALRLGLEIGRQYGYQHFLWWWPAAMSRVCARALEEGIESD